MRVTIHQPEHIPWLGFFHKVNMADTYVVLDNVQYRRRYFQNRNKIRTKSGEQYITVPIIKESRDTLLIKDVRIFNNNRRWKHKNIGSVFTAYSKSKCFKDYFDKFQEIYLKEFELLIDLNLEFIKYFVRTLGIGTKVMRASSLNINGRKGDLILNICKKLNAETYITGISGCDYLNMKDFEKAGIEIVYQEFHHPIYKQLYKPFIPCMSIIDLLFNYGDKSLDVIKGVDATVMDKIFL